MKRVISQLFIHHTGIDRESHEDPLKLFRWWELVGRYKYHYLISKDGTIYGGNSLERPKVNVTGFDNHAVHIGVYGVDDFTFAQGLSLHTVLYELKSKYPNATVDPHRMFAPNETCPNFKDKFLFENGGIDGYQVTKKERS